MEEKKYRINWLGLFIKVIVFVVVVLLAIWLITRITSKKKGLSFNENNQKFKDATVEYFTNNLPEENTKKTVTLNKLINLKYVDKLKNEKGKVCDKNSKATIEEVDGYYTIKTEFKCGKVKETNYTKIGNTSCEECDIKIENLKLPEQKENKKEKAETKKQENNNNTNTNTNTNTNASTNTSSSNNASNYSNNNSNNNLTNNSTNNSPSTITLYEYIKEANEYSDWYTGKVTGKNIENSKQNISYSKYCKNEETTYYTISSTSYISNYKYTLELINTSSYSNLKLLSSNYFTSIDDYNNYLKLRNSTVYMVNGINNEVSTNENPYTYKNASLTSSNYTLSTSNIYTNNNKNYIDINISIKNLNGVSPVYSQKAGKKVYYIPVKFAFGYINLNNCKTDKTENKNNYNGYTIVDTWNESIDVYRYKITTKEYKYSNQTYLEGYTKTGNTKQVNK